MGLNIIVAKLYGARLREGPNEGCYDYFDRLSKNSSLMRSHEPTFYELIEETKQNAINEIGRIKAEIKKQKKYKKSSKY